MGEKDKGDKGKPPQEVVRLQQDDTAIFQKEVKEIRESVRTDTTPFADKGPRPVTEKCAPTATGAASAPEEKKS